LVNIIASTSIVNICPGEEARARVRLRAEGVAPTCTARYKWTPHRRRRPGCCLGLLGRTEVGLLRRDAHGRRWRGVRRAPCTLSPEARGRLALPSARKRYRQPRPRPATHGRVPEHFALLSRRFDARPARTIPRHAQRRRIRRDPSVQMDALGRRGRFGAGHRLDTR
jgi:hypothetical protein